MGPQQSHADSGRSPRLERQVRRFPGNNAVAGTKELKLNHGSDGASRQPLNKAGSHHARTGTLAVRSSLPQLTHAPLIGPFSRGWRFICAKFPQTTLFSGTSKLSGTPPSQIWVPLREP